MILNCAIIDDEPLAAELLASYADKTPSLNLIGCYNSAVSAIKNIREKSIDILFLDIQMPELSGLEFAKLIPKQTNKNHLHNSIRPVCHRGIQGKCTRLPAQAHQLRELPHERSARRGMVRKLI